MNENDILDHEKFSRAMIECEEFFYVRQFDTIQMMRKVLTKSLKSNVDYPLKKIDINTLLMVGYNPYKSMSFFSQKVNVENGSFTYVANKLENLGLIELVQDKEDKRKKVLVLTKEGQEVVISLRKNLNDHIENNLSKLTIEEKKSFFNCMATMREIINKINE